MSQLSIITPWLNHPELIPEYERVVQNGAEVIIIDNGSDIATADLLDSMVNRLNGKIIHNKENRGFGIANMQGVGIATNDIIMFLNNDVVLLDSRNDWLLNMDKDIKTGMIAGPSVKWENVDGRPVQYMEGWCITARRATWESLGWWNTDKFQLPYWEDVYVGWLSRLKGIIMRKFNWPLHHINSVTSDSYPELKRGWHINRRIITDLIRNGDLYG